MKNYSGKILLALALGLFAITPARAQIAYVRALSDTHLQVRRMNSNGTGDAAFNLPFTLVGFPTFSRDGKEMAVAAYEPILQGLHSWNVFGVNTATGAVRKLTDYHDILDPTHSAFSYTFPYYKAFSPNHAFLATFSVTQTGGSGDSGGGNVSTVPVLEIHSLNSVANPIQVHTDKYANGIHHGGEGVDWSPKTNLLAAPLVTTTNFLSGGGPGTVTAIYQIQPVNAAVLTGRAQQLTFPRSDANIGTGVMWTEHDYQPKYSPNGAGVAFVRSFQAHALTSSLVPDFDVQSLHIVNVNTGVDTQIAQFPKGTYITTLDWSPNGAQLIFDLAKQDSNSIVGPQQHGIASTNQIYIINVDGTGLKQLRGNTNGTPAWSRTALPAVAAPGASAQLANISSRVFAGAGDSAPIAGFIITGTQAKKVVIRGIGPSLTKAGVSGALANPTLELHQGSKLIASNDDWRSAQAAVVATGVPPTNNAESAIVRTLAPGAYTAVLRGKNNSTGVGLIEVYDLNTATKSTLANISTRGAVGTGDNVLIGGLAVVGKTGSVKVAVRALGASLAALGVHGALFDPTLEIYNASGTRIASNDNWQSTQKAALTAAKIAPTRDTESALITTLPAGRYTAIVRGKNNTAGVGLVDVYTLK